LQPAGVAWRGVAQAKRIADAPVQIRAQRLRAVAALIAELDSEIDPRDHVQRLRGQSSYLSPKYN